MAQKYTGPIYCGKYYHIFNRGVAMSPIFFNPGNRIYFLKKFRKYFSELGSLLAYSLLSNHFHLLVRFKEKEEINPNFLRGDRIIPKPLAYFFNSYAQAINKQESRIGSLFQNPFRRIEICSESRLVRTLLYIHGNPQKHKLISNFKEYAYSSYREIIIRPENSFVEIDEVLTCFDGWEGFMTAHDDYYDFLKGGA